MKKKNKWLAVMLVTLLSYGMAWMLGSMWPVLQVWYAQVLIAVAAGGVYFFLESTPLEIKAQTVGDGQHGNSHWMDDTRKNRYSPSCMSHEQAGLLWDTDESLGSRYQRPQSPADKLRPAQERQQVYLFRRFITMPVSISIQKAGRIDAYRRL